MTSPKEVNGPTALEGKTVREAKGDPYKVTQERLWGGETVLTGFFFHWGANVYVLSYPQGGKPRHTLIDTGDPSYQDRILSLLSDTGIEPREIERIILTHRHYDHCGLAHILSKHSGAPILAHAAFRPFVEGPLSETDRLWLQGFDPSCLRECPMEYLSPGQEHPPLVIDGLVFPRLAGPFPLGTFGRLEVLACPESSIMHSPDQLIVLYRPNPKEEMNGHVRPTDHLLFSGDLWLMHGPLFSKGFRALSMRVRLASRLLKGAIKGRKYIRRDPREQDLAAKEALKRGFMLIRVLPGHGEDFIGTRLVPRCFLCQRDLLVQLGFALDEKKSVLYAPSLAPRIEALKEQAYREFQKEISLWRGSGYDTEEAADLLLRIYREQEGGGPLVKEDRKERRRIIEEILRRLRLDPTVDPEIQGLAEKALKKIQEAFDT